MMKPSPLLSLMLLVLAAACSKQSEGQRCNRVNGDNDCEEGLICVGARAGDSCDGQNPTYNCLPNLCCPPAPQRSAVAQCNQYQYGEAVSTGGSASVDAGEGETGGTDTSAGGSSSTQATGGSETGGNTSTEPTPDAGA